MDEDLLTLDREQLMTEVKRLRAGIRAHRDSSGHALCWHPPQLWGLLPEPTPRTLRSPPGRSSCGAASATGSLLTANSRTRRHAEYNGLGSAQA